MSSLKLFHCFFTEKRGHNYKYIHFNIFNEEKGTPKIIAGIKIRNYFTFHSRLVIQGLYGNFIILLAII